MTPWHPSMSGLGDTYHKGVMCAENLEVRGYLKAPNLELPEKLKLDELSAEKATIKDLVIEGILKVKNLKLPKLLSITGLKVDDVAEIKHLRVTESIEMPHSEPVKEMSLEQLSSNNILGDKLDIKDNAKLPSSVEFGADTVTYFRSAYARTIKSKSFPVDGEDSCQISMPIEAIGDSNNLFMADKKGGYTYRGVNELFVVIDLEAFFSIIDDCKLSFEIRVNDKVVSHSGKIDFTSGSNTAKAKAFLKIKKDDKLTAFVYNAGDKALVNMLSYSLNIGPR